ncbi:hypothetical protein CLOM_g6775, partial [Closterium sp. NIES-68]
LEGEADTSSTETRITTTATTSTTTSNSSSNSSSNSNSNSSSSSSSVCLSHRSLSFLPAPHRLLPATTVLLTHNQMSSLAGFEALQNLQVLDLSHNQIAFSSAVAPLAHLPALRALSLAHNLLGARPVDCHRYSHPSPRCNRLLPWSRQSASGVVTSGEVGEGTSGTQSAAAAVVRQHPNLWAVLQCLGGLYQVAVLDLTGNLVCQWGGYRELVLALLPQLVRFDGASTAAAAGTVV